ncbi:Uncharacterised protein [Helicobacter cinaedi]|uniref:Uncharacterized protein n=1 Tax=Helicobacter cinaedi TaxID=213 RepID=A0A377JUW4_9HELI|nr:Uncharacterised protein [Helicobacter cinaedi]
MLTRPALPNHTLDSRFCIVFFCSVRVGFFVDFQSLANDLHLRHALKCGKINRTQCHLLKRCRGGGIFKGEGATSQFKPLPLKEKKQLHFIFCTLIFASTYKKEQTPKSRMISLAILKTSLILIYKSLKTN